MLNLDLNCIKRNNIIYFMIDIILYLYFICTQRFPFLDRVWSRQKQIVCLLCGYKTKKTSSKANDLILCANEGCNGVYCSKCFVDINNQCTLCSSPINYGDITDISEEKYTNIIFKFIYTECSPTWSISRLNFYSE